MWLHYLTAHAQCINYTSPHRPVIRRTPEQLCPSSSSLVLPRDWWLQFQNELHALSLLTRREKNQVLIEELFKERVVYYFLKARFEQSYCHYINSCNTDSMYWSSNPVWVVGIGLNKRSKIRYYIYNSKLYPKRIAYERGHLVMFHN